RPRFAVHRDTRSCLLRDDDRQRESVRRVPGGSGEQPQRRNVLGTLPALLRQLWTRCRSDRCDQGRLSGGLGRPSSRHRAAPGSGVPGGGMIVQAAGIWLTVMVPAYPAWITGAVLQGVGTAMVYPTLLAAITDHTHPTSRATSLGVYRFWRDSGYAIGALLSGIVA